MKSHFLPRIVGVGGLSPADGIGHTPGLTWPGESFRSRCAVRQRRLHRFAEGARHPDQHEPQKIRATGALGWPESERRNPRRSQLIVPMSLQLAIPWPVALQQGRPPLHQLDPFSGKRLRRTTRFHPTASCGLTGCLSSGVHSTMQAPASGAAARPPKGTAGCLLQRKLDSFAPDSRGSLPPRHLQQPHVRDHGPPARRAFPLLHPRERAAGHFRGLLQPHRQLAVLGQPTGDVVFE